MKIKNYTLRVEEELLRKFHYVAKYDGRSVNGQMISYLRKSVDQFEREHGKIEPETEKEER